MSLRAIQEQMGHDERPKTTALYTQLSNRTRNDTDRRINGLRTRSCQLYGRPEFFEGECRLISADS